MFHTVREYRNEMVMHQVVRLVRSPEASQPFHIGISDNSQGMEMFEYVESDSSYTRFSIDNVWLSPFSIDERIYPQLKQAFTDRKDLANDVYGGNYIPYRIYWGAGMIPLVPKAVIWEMELYLTQGVNLLPETLVKRLRKNAEIVLADASVGEEFILDVVLFMNNAGRTL